MEKKAPKKIILKDKDVSTKKAKDIKGGPTAVELSKGQNFPTTGFGGFNIGQQHGAGGGGGAG